MKQSLAKFSKSFKTPEAPQPSQAFDAETQAQKDFFQKNHLEAYKWGRASQIFFWLMTATIGGGVIGVMTSALQSGALAGAGAAAGEAAAMGGAAAATGGLALPVIAGVAALGATFGAISFATGYIERKMRINDTFAVEELYAKRVGVHTGKEVEQALNNVMGTGKEVTKTITQPEIYPAGKSGNAELLPHTIREADNRILTESVQAEALSQGNPKAITLH
jgi:hypothetical protein